MLPTRMETPTREIVGISGKRLDVKCPTDNSGTVSRSSLLAYVLFWGQIP